MAFRNDRSPKLRSVAASILAVLSLSAAAAEGALAPQAAAPGAAGGAAASSAAKLLGEAVYAEVQSKGKAVRTGAVLEILPSHPAAESIRAAVAAAKPGVLVESAFAIPRARSADPAKAKAELAAIYGVMRSFGSMKGIEYYSASRKKMRTLYAESHRVDDATKRDPLPDEPAPSADAIPASETFIVLQEDLSTGTNVYSYSFSSYPEAVLVGATNLTRMSYGIVPAVGVGGLKSWLLVIAADDAIVFYSASAADPPGILKGRLGESLANRAEAMFRWFSSKSAAFLQG
jgi:hypothetical protein